MGIECGLKRTGLLKDVKEICQLVADNGASKTAIIKAGRVVVDQRVQLKCRYPPCDSYGGNLMCPPFTPSAAEFKKYLSRYKYGILIQVEGEVPQEIRPYLWNKQISCAELWKDEGFRKLYDPWNIELWKKLHRVVSYVEREAFVRRYYLSLGILRGRCRLCNECDTKSLCKHPFEARPSMEAMGIDVDRTVRKVGLNIEWGQRTKVHHYGLVMIG